jgi:single-stranded-DNA-specific exonuclease
MNGIAFGMYEHNDLIKDLNPFDICYTIEENTYVQNASIQLLIKDIKAELTPKISEPKV